MSASSTNEPVKCDVLIVGASVGGVAAALAAADSGSSVRLIEETNWLGGQLTAQGVCTPDENAWVETCGAARTYRQFRERVRQYYRTEYRLSKTGSEQTHLNPGSCWVSGLSFEPKVGAAILADMLAPWAESGRVRLHLHTRPVSCEMDARMAGRIAEVRAVDADGRGLVFLPTLVIDATDTGELLPLCGAEGIDWVIGAESRDVTGEPDAPIEARPDWVQPFTFPFGLEWSPQTVSDNRIEQPPGYDELKRTQKYHVIHGAITGIFTGRAPWWRYRRIVAKENFDDPRMAADIAMINTAGNDYYGGNILGSLAGDADRRRATLQKARLASLGYLYWLQNECPREEGGGVGYPEFRLRTDLFDTPDGCAVRPYIRESRRILSRRRILEQEIVVKDFQGGVQRGANARAAWMPGSVGIGHYALDIHPNGHGEPNYFVATRPFQIPFGALVPVRLQNYLPGCKNIGTTHLTNGAYRLHPIEWAIGEAAGRAAALCAARRIAPADVLDDAALLRSLQSELVRKGSPIYWFTDVPEEHPAYFATQMLAAEGAPISAESHMEFMPAAPITQAEWDGWRAGRCAGEPLPPNRGDAAIWLARFADDSPPDPPRAA